MKTDTVIHPQAGPQSPLPPVPAWHPEPSGLGLGLWISGIDKLSSMDTAHGILHNAGYRTLGIGRGQVGAAGKPPGRRCPHRALHT